MSCSFWLSYYCINIDTLTGRHSDQKVEIEENLLAAGSCPTGHINEYPTMHYLGIPDTLSQ